MALVLLVALFLGAAPFFSPNAADVAKRPLDYSRANWKPDEDGEYIHPIAIRPVEKVAKSWVV
jgi:hypothetical protein